MKSSTELDLRVSAMLSSLLSLATATEALRREPYGEAAENKQPAACCIVLQSSVPLCAQTSARASGNLARKRLLLSPHHLPFGRTCRIQFRTLPCSTTPLPNIPPNHSAFLPPKVDHYLRGLAL